MKCPGCGYVSFDQIEACKGCGAPLAAPAAPSPAVRRRRPGAPHPPSGPAGGQLELFLESKRIDPVRPDQGRRRRRPQQEKRNDGGSAFIEMFDNEIPRPVQEDLSPGPPARAGFVGTDDGGIPFQIDGNLFQGNLSGDQSVSGTAAPAAAWTHQGSVGPEAAGQSGPAFVAQDEELLAASGEPPVDLEEEVLGCRPAPEAAGLGRRTVALLVDQALLAAILGVFFLGAFLALRISGFDTGHFLSAAGLRASLAPFALLFALLSLVYHASFHGSTGRTPGKALSGVAVQTGEGAVPSGARAVLRWFCAALGLACAGLGFAWALFDPTRRGWADRLSGTVIARQPREPSGGLPRR